MDYFSIVITAILIVYGFLFVRIERRFGRLGEIESNTEKRLDKLDQKLDEITKMLQAIANKQIGEQK